MQKKYDKVCFTQYCTPYNSSFSITTPDFYMENYSGATQVICSFFDSIKCNGADVLCYPYKIPGLIRLPLFILACPGPLRSEDCSRLGVDGDALIAQGVLRRLSIDGWYGLSTLDSSRCIDSSVIKRLTRFAYNPVKKLINTFAWRRSVQRQAHAQQSEKIHAWY